MEDALARWMFIGIGFTSAAVYAVLAVVAFRQRLRRPVLNWWAVYCAVAGVHLVSLVAGEFVHSASQAEPVIRGALSLGGVSMFFFFLFAVHVTKLRRGRRFWLGLGSMGGLVVLGLIWAGDLVVAGVTGSEFARFSPIPGPLTPLYMNYVAFNWIFALVLFIQRFRRVRGRERTQTAYTLVAFFFGLVGSAGFLLPSVTGSQSLLALLPAFLFPLFPLTITYAMIRLRLWDVRTIAHRTLVWVVLSLLLALPVYLLLFLVARCDAQLTDMEAAVGLSLLFLLGFFYLSRVKPRLDRFFGRGAYDRRRVLDDFERDMAGIKGPDEVCRLIRQTIASTLQPEWIRLYLRSGDGPWFEMPAEGGIREVETGQMETLWGALPEGSVSLDRSRLPAGDLRQWMERQEGHALLGLGQREDERTARGLILLGERRNLKAFARGDLELLDSIAAASVIALTNALLFERVDSQRKALEDLTVNLEKRVAERTGALDEANRKLRGVNERLRELDRMKNQFFANISHELRTPLSLILAPVETMLEEGRALDSRQKTHLRTIQRSGQKLFLMIEDLLDLCKLEDSRTTLEVARLELTDFLGRLGEAVRPLAERKGIDLRLDLAPDLVLEADQAKLERILINLLGNALKFTEERGRIVLSAEADDDWIRVRVRDDGCGIDPEDLPHIFDRFHQGTAGGQRRQGGVGIGLALALELAQLHGGTLAADSQKGQGACFTLCLPMRLDHRLDERIQRRGEAGQGVGDAGELEAVERYARRSLGFRLMDLGDEPPPRIEGGTRLGPKSARILVVDDNRDLLIFLRDLLQERYEVWTAADGAEAMVQLKEQRFELVLADVMMPGMSGLELCHRIKSDPVLADTPVVLLTARAGQEHRIEGHHVGADQYLSKPFQPRELMAVVERLLLGRSRNAQMAARRSGASLDSLLAGMAHEMRNACHQAKNAHAAVRQLIEGRGQDHAGQGDKLLAMSQIVDRALERVERVVDSLQVYANQRSDDIWEEMCLSELVREEVPGLRVAQGKEVALTLELAEGAELRGPREALRQLVVNLVDNALRAVEPGGRVRVSTQSAPGQVVLEVEDDGCGIPPEQKDAVFDLFFTTRAPGQGTGMGLALSRKTVEEMGGRILLDSQIDVGTRVTITLPARPGADGPIGETS